MKISIITPCYNSEKTIERTIKSVVSQAGNFEIEYIIIDGKSTDNTLKIIEKYVEKFKYIKCISEKDNSMTEALNKGLKLSTGDIVCSINADDEYIGGSIKAVIDKFEYNLDINIIAGNCYIIDEVRNRIRYKLCSNHFNYILANILDCMAAECQIFFRKSIFEKVGYFNENIKYTQDFELYLRMLKNGYKVYYLDKDISKFYMSNDNYSTKNKIQMIEEVKGYIQYKWLHKIFSFNKLNQLVRILLGIRRGVRN